MTERPILLVKTGGLEAIPDWRACFAEWAPGLEVRWWDDPAVAPGAVRYALAWDPEPGRLASLPNLRLIISSGAGVDGIVRGDPLWPRGVPMLRMGGAEPAQRMGEYVAWACLSLLRGARRMALGQAERRWDYFDAEHHAPERRVGIMGLGNLGTRAAEMTRDLGFQVAGWSRTRKDVRGVESFAGAAEFDAFLARTDLLVCLLPITAETEGIIAAPLLAKLPAGAAVVNVGRGGHARLDDILAALDSGHMSGAVLDVFETEPLPADHPLWAHPRVIVTPHLASLASRRERARYVAAAIAAFEAGAPLPNRYDPERGY